LASPWWCGRSGRQLVLCRGRIASAIVGSVSRGLSRGESAKARGARAGGRGGDAALGLSGESQPYRLCACLSSRVDIELAQDR
jgi:hypothetical protein